MTERDIAILHLSDLHIKKTESGLYSEELERLLEDIKSQTSYISEIIIVVTGDVIDKADFSGAETIALKFFQELYNVLEGKVCFIKIVPGNHDLVRKTSSINTTIHLENLNLFDFLNKYKNEPLSSILDYLHININEYDKELCDCRRRFPEFLKLTNAIYKIYGMDEINETFGVSILNLGKSCIAFVSVNTAWNATGNDAKHLKVGKSQLEKLCKNYREKYDKLKPKLTIVLAHHPTNWLAPNEEELFLSYLLDKDFLGAHIFICGHTHEAKAINYSSHEHSMHTFISGIGQRRASPSDSKTQKRYSIYKINTSFNSCSIIVRASRQDGSYSYDYSLYTNQKDEEMKKLVYPLHMNGISPFFHHHSTSIAHAESLYVDDNILSKTIKMINALNAFKDKMQETFSEIKIKLLKKFEESLATKDYLATDTFLCETAKIKQILVDTDNLEVLRSDSNFKQSIENIFNPLNSEINTHVSMVESFLYHNGGLDSEVKLKWKRICNTLDKQEEHYFTIFLLRICRALVQNIISFFPRDTYVRVHFRAYAGLAEEGRITKDDYISWCHELLPEYELPSLKNLNYGGLIKRAVDEDKSLIFSSNRDIADEFANTSWDNFLTIIPKNYDTSLHITVKDDTNRPIAERPLLTFGVSIRGNNDVGKSSEVLTILDHLKLDTYISNLIGDYIRFFYLNIDDFAAHIHAHSLKNK